MGIATTHAALHPATTQLQATTFVIVDTETTGGSANYHHLTEVAALKVCGGHVIGHLRSLIVNRLPIPAMIVTLTGITDAMCCVAPEEIEVLGAFTSFVGDATLVGHNLRFDLSFLNAALSRWHAPALNGPTIDTLSLARRLLRGEVENFKLATLAEYLGLRRPTHRALADVLTTTDLLHELIGRLGSMGVTTLEDLEHFSTPKSSRHDLTRT
ncbi:exonuclease domain-containing protein [Ferrimicrobium sp.]|uniref:exonuclease domain-containing protein n=1 Tax=Ferrimicrobium sp. TaxID=2926050 RepID=UPI00260AB560|nr:exonuclease domain-containing protein [Ferrimicrobium sp.]